jgi:hypothetical protein
MNGDGVVGGFDCLVICPGHNVMVRGIRACITLGLASLSNRGIVGQARTGALKDEYDFRIPELR